MLNRLDDILKNSTMYLLKWAGRKEELHMETRKGTIISNFTINGSHFLIIIIITIIDK